MTRDGYMVVPARIQPDPDGEFVRVGECTRADIQAELKWTDSRERATDLRRLLRLLGPSFRGSAVVGDFLPRGDGP